LPSLITCTIICQELEYSSIWFAIDLATRLSFSILNSTSQERICEPWLVYNDIHASSLQMEARVELLEKELATQESM